MRTETKDQYFKETVEQLKEWGFMVYAPANIFEDDFRYGWVTDGIHILYFQIDDLLGLVFSTECVPSKETGCGRRIDFDFTKKGIIKAFEISFGKPYPNFESFKRKHWSTLIQL